jgi:glutathione S-transferase
MITLHTFGPYFEQPDGSPFVIKAMILLKMAGLAFVEKRSAPFNAPKAKLPYIDDEGEKIADTTFIRLHIQKKYGFDYEAGLSSEQKAWGWALERMLDEHFYWLAISERWLDDENFARGPASFFNRMPAPMRPLVKSMVRGKMRKAAYAQGLSRHNAEERRLLARRDLESCAALLGDRPFLFGHEPRGADATLAAFMLAALSPVFRSAIREELQKLPSLCSYAWRMESIYFPAKK